MALGQIQVPTTSGERAGVVFFFVLGHKAAKTRSWWPRWHDVLPVVHARVLTQHTPEGVARPCTASTCVRTRYAATHLISSALSSSLTCPPVQSIVSTRNSSPTFASATCRSNISGVGSSGNTRYTVGVLHSVHGIGTVPVHGRACRVTGRCKLATWPLVETSLATCLAPLSSIPVLSMVSHGPDTVKWESVAAEAHRWDIGVPSVVKGLRLLAGGLARVDLQPLQRKTAMTETPRDSCY